MDSNSEIHVETAPKPQNIPSTSSSSSPDSAPSLTPEALPVTPSPNSGEEEKSVEVVKPVEVPIKPINQHDANIIVEAFAQKPGADTSGNEDAKVLHDGPDADPTLTQIKANTKARAEKQVDEVELKKPENAGRTREELLQEEFAKLDSAEMDQFLIDYPEKAEKYKNDPSIQSAIERKQKAEEETDRQIMELMGYSEEEITEEFSKHPYLLPHEQATFLMLKNLRASSDLPKEVREKLGDIYHDKLQKIFLRKINDARADPDKVTLEQVKEGDIRALLGAIEIDPALQDKATVLNKMIEELVVEKDVAVKEVEAEKNETNATEVKPDDASSENTKDQKEKKIKFSPIKEIFKLYFSELNDLSKEAIRDVIEKYKREDFFDLAEFLTFLLSGESAGYSSAGHSESGHHGKEGEEIEELSVFAVKEYTKEQPEAEIELLLKGLAGAGFQEEADAYESMTPEEVFKDPQFSEIIHKAFDGKEQEFSYAVAESIKKDKKIFTLSAEAKEYLLNLPGLRLAEMRS